MPWKDITSGDYGWVGKLTVREDGVAVDLSSYTTLQLILRSPEGVESTVAAEFDTDGTDGVLSYTVTDGDIDSAGRWQVRARVAKTGVVLNSAWHLFQVGS